MEIPLTPREKWYCRQISRDGKKHSLSGETGQDSPGGRVLHASAKPCLNIVLELTEPRRATTNRNEAQLEQLATGRYDSKHLDSLLRTLITVTLNIIIFLFSFLIDFFYIEVYTFRWKNKTESFSPWFAFNCYYMVILFLREERCYLIANRRI